MDSIDDCRISCRFVRSVTEREKLRQRLEDLEDFKDKICRALNYVCESKARYSCLQCYDDEAHDYVTTECKTSCESGYVRYSYCFELNNDYILNIIAEKPSDVIIVTFYPFHSSDLKTLKNKCDNIINPI